MAGRGRGGKTSSFTQEQLQTLGSLGKDLPQVLATPPLTFPPLMSKPVSVETTAAQNYQILWKEDFLNNMRDSPYFITPLVDKKVTRSQYISERLGHAIESTKTKNKADFPWHRMPTELQAVNKKRRTVVKHTEIPSKKPKTDNIVDRLKALEEKERSEKDKETVVQNGSDSEHEGEEELAVDEEMDDENDYGNSYFDNGESYNEEDDNLDDGPVY